MSSIRKIRRVWEREQQRLAAIERARKWRELEEKAIARALLNEEEDAKNTRTKSITSPLGVMATMAALGINI